MRKLGIGVVALFASATLVGCNDKAPSLETQAAEVAQLETHVVPVVDELDVTFYLDEGKSCNGIIYPAGEFRDGDYSCGSVTENYGKFDAKVRTDFDRIRTAIEKSGVPTHRFDASVGSGGVLREVTFPREDGSWQWNWSYLYDPTDSVTKDRRSGEPTMGSPTYTEIGKKWWLVTAVDD